MIRTSEVSYLNKIDPAGWSEVQISESTTIRKLPCCLDEEVGAPREEASLPLSQGQSQDPYSVLRELPSCSCLRSLEYHDALSTGPEQRHPQQVPKMQLLPCPSLHLPIPFPFNLCPIPRPLGYSIAVLPKLDLSVSAPSNRPPPIIPILCFVKINQFES